MIGPEQTLQAVAGLCLLAHHIQHRVDELSALCVVPLGPVVSRTSLQACASSAAPERQLAEKVLWQGAILLMQCSACPRQLKLRRPRCNPSLQTLWSL